MPRLQDLLFPPSGQPRPVTHFSPAFAQEPRGEAAAPPARQPPEPHSAAQTSVQRGGGAHRLRRPAWGGPPAELQQGRYMDTMVSSACCCPEWLNVSCWHLESTRSVYHAPFAKGPVTSQPDTWSSYPLTRFSVGVRPLLFKQALDKLVQDATRERERLCKWGWGCNPLSLVKSPCRYHLVQRSHAYANWSWTVTRSPLNHAN